MFGMHSKVFTESFGTLCIRQFIKQNSGIFPEFLIPLNYLLFKNSCQSRPNWRITALNVPSFKSFEPQSGSGAIFPFFGLCQIRCEPAPRCGNSSHSQAF